ncbi:hypothetical protein PJO11_001507 [Campylobacter coli]|nr:hypothetical protein [Campylobacter coli]
METLLTIIPRVFVVKEMITDSFYLYAAVVIYLVILSILFKIYKEKIDSKSAITAFSIALSFIIIFIICSFIFQYYTTEIPFLFLWEILIFIIVISYVLIFLLFPQAFLRGLIVVTITLFSFFVQTPA